MAFSEATGSNGIMFAGDGPVMEGTWQNPQTGHKFTVRDSFFQDGQLMVQTTDGQVLDYNTIQNYIQCTDSHGNNVNVPVQTPVTGKPTPQNNIPSEVASLIMPEGPAGAGEDEFMTAEDMEMIKGLGTLNGPATMNREGVRVQQPAITTSANPAVDPDEAMIDRVLKRHPLPELNAEISWPGLPLKQIETLVDILGIDPEQIASYYIGKLDRVAIFEAMKVGLVQYINGIFEAPAIQEESEVAMYTATVDDDPIEEPKKVEEKSKKKPVKKSKK